MRIAKIAWLGLLLIAIQASAHQDMAIEIMADGELVGLPGEFSPASLKVNYSSRSSGAPIESIDLRLAGNEVKIPICVVGLIHADSLGNVRASASWYHTRSGLPPYLSVRMYDPGFDDDEWANSGYSLLFDLRTAKLIKMEVMIVRGEGRSLQHVAVDLLARCSDSELASFYHRHEALRPPR